MSMNNGDCDRIGREGIELFKPFFHARFEGAIAYIEKGVMAETLQITIGDAVANNYAKETVCLEFKTEKEDKYGNFFLEEYSNYQPHDLRWNKPGWMQTSLCDWIVYIFLNKKMAYCIRFADLKIWSYQTPNSIGGSGRIRDYELKPQKKYEQKNETYGFCPKIATIEYEVGFIKVQRCGDDFLLRPVVKPFTDGATAKTPDILPASLVPRKPRQGCLFD